MTRRNTGPSVIAAAVIHAVNARTGHRRPWVSADLRSSGRRRRRWFHRQAGGVAFGGSVSQSIPETLRDLLLPIDVEVRALSEGALAASVRSQPTHCIQVVFQLTCSWMGVGAPPRLASRLFDF